MFRISQGPWTKMFEGSIEGQSAEIYSNEESMILVLVYEKEGDKIVGVVLELFKAFACSGEIEAFTETLPKDAVVFLKHGDKKTFKFFALGSSPSYSLYDENAVIEEFESLLKRLNAATQMISEVSKAYDLSLVEIQKASDEEKQTFFAEPLTMQMLSHSTALPQKKPSAMSQEPVGPVGELLLGITKEGAIAKEPLQLFAKTIITGPQEKYRMHCAHIVIEGALLSSLSVIVIDWKNSFRGLSEPSKDLQGLKKFKVDFDPIGFPVAHFTVPENVKIALETTNMHGLLELFGAGANAATKLIEQKNSSKRHRNTADLIETIKKTGPTEEASIYQLNKAIRLLSLFELHYPNLLDGQNNFDEIAKSWMKGLGRAGIIHLENTDAITGLLVVHSITKGLVEHFKRQGMTNRIRAMIVIPEARKIMPSIEATIVSKNIASELIELQGYGVGFAISAEKITDITKEIADAIEAEIGIIEKNDVGIKLKDRKNYRALIRPGLSSCTEI